MSESTETVTARTKNAKRSKNGSRPKGLAVDRVWTTDGVHPYDEVAWERRDVVMTNWRDGSINFEQRGVEFPEFWSVNATNIVTSKYFRGAVGTDAREWSLKQLIDRVVKTYRQAGEKHGYFRSTQDAQIFEDELTWLLLHQYFSFNSPVWFNVGTESPQQVSACQPYDAPVSTPQGLVPIGRLVEDDAIGTKVYDADGVTRIVAVKANGTKNVLRIHTTAGYTLDVTADHLVWRSGGDTTGQFVPAGELQPGDRLQWHRRDAFGGQEFSATQMYEAALAGWLQADDAVGRNGRSATIAVTVADGEERDWVTAALENVVDTRSDGGVIETSEDGVPGRRSIRIDGGRLSRLVERWELTADHAAATVPDVLYTASLDVVRAYLRSLFQVAGYVSGHDRDAFVAVDLPSGEMVRGVQRLLLRFGIFSQTSLKQADREGDGGVWTLRIAAAGDRSLFAAHIGFISPSKAARLAKGFGDDAPVACDIDRLEISRIEELGSMDVYDIQTESGEYLSGNLRVHNCFILSVDDSMDSILEWYKEEGLIFKGGSGAGVNLSNIRSSKELLSSGGNASGPVSFMRGADASAGTIKSGGATRRAAKMVILDVDHPDIEEFIDTKAREEDKIRALRDAGFDMDLGGKDIVSVQYQNANNSVRVSDEFMAAVENGSDFALRARQDGREIERVDAKALFRKMAQAAWECADPGIQYDDTINDWHTSPETGRITASNPCCFTGDTLVSTSQGRVSFEQLHKRLETGESVHVTTRDMETGRFTELPVTRAWVAGHTAQLVEVETGHGARLRCTPEHRFLTTAGWVEAKDLTSDTTLVSDTGHTTVAAVTEVTLDEPVAVYDMEVDRTHNFVVASEGTAGVVVHNSEYLHLDNSSCNLASLNLMKFLADDGSFDTEKFIKAVEFVITAMEISISFADFPTEKIAQTTRDFRQLGIGYANLGALLMASGMAYDSDDGRALASAITAVMTGASYRRSAEIAEVVGPYAGYEANAHAHQRVMRKHAAAVDDVVTTSPMAKSILVHAAREWKQGNRLGEEHGWRNAQASVIAPTGCLTADTMVTTDRGLTRLGELGDVYGDRWQDIDLAVSTDDGPRQATKFFINGEEPTRRVVTAGGYRIQGTLTHRVKVIDRASGEWVWKRMADISVGDVMPLQLGTLVGAPRPVALPGLTPAVDAADQNLSVPEEVTEELAELIGYFTAGGDLDTTGIRLRVADEDLDLVERFKVMGKGLFGIEPTVTTVHGHWEVTFRSDRLAHWWQTAGFAAGRLAGAARRIPSAILETNCRTAYAAFAQGVFEAAGSVSAGIPVITAMAPEFAHEVQTLLLTIGLATTTRQTPGDEGTMEVRLRDHDHATRFAELVGFMSDRKNRAVAWQEPEAIVGNDDVHLPEAVWNALVPEGHPLHDRVTASLGRTGGVARRIAGQILAETGDDRLAFAMEYLYEQVADNADGGVQPTYDLSVPSNVTYVANGMVSHNTIGFMMDCDTTGIEPDLALVKFKKLVGGGSMQIVNQTVPRALATLGYAEETIEAIVEYIAEHGHVVDAPGLRQEHYSVFDCAMGERSISAMGHVRMMAAAQPWVSGAISKTVNVPESATVEDFEKIYFEGWKLGLKALAVYRDNCKVGQPLSVAKKNETKAEPEVVVEHRPVRKRLPKKRPSQTVSFSVAGAEGYMTASSYPDNGVGEVFFKMSKQGSTLAGIMDAFSVAISIALQYGVPLEKYVEKFTNMRFEPAGMTDDPDIRMATSVVDYLFRRLALDYLPFQTRADLGILTAAERAAEVRGEDPAAVHSDEEEVDFAALASSAPIEKIVEKLVEESPQVVGSSTELLERVQGKAADAPLCMTCGTKMRPAGSCYVCEGCGSTSGCS